MSSTAFAGTLIAHQNEQGRRSVVGTGKLSAWVERWIHQSTGKARPLLSAQIHYVTEHKLPLVRELFQESRKGTWRVHFFRSEMCCPALPTWLIPGLGLQSGSSYELRMRAVREEGWHPFQRIIDAESAAVEGNLLFVKAQDLETQELSAEFRFCARTASPWWVFVHQQMAYFALDTGDSAVQDDPEDDGEDEASGDETDGVSDDEGEEEDDAIINASISPHQRLAGEDEHCARRTAKLHTPSQGDPG